ncbi:MAG: DUF4347 domain-containing protein, partial [Cyanobacteria bacterium J06648_11]
MAAHPSLGNCPDAPGRVQLVAPSSALASPLHVVVVDAAIAHAEALIAGVREGVRVFTLDSARDSVAYIADRLAGLDEPVASLHLISHGSPGCLQLGASRLDLQAIARDRDRLAEWARSFAPNARVALYGCRVAAGRWGNAFVEHLSQLWQVPVSASSTLVGRAARGGNWDLDVKTGASHPCVPQLAFRSEVLVAYPGTLADIRYEAEDASYFGPIFQTGRASSGTGYVDFQRLFNQFIEWTIDVPLAGEYDFTFRYANGDANNRPMSLMVNGAIEDGSVDFFNTGKWTDWGFLELQVPLQAGTNTVRFTTLGNRGSNFDYVNVTEIVPGRVTYEAEAATYDGPIVQTGRAASGTGYLDFQFGSNQYVEWTVDAPVAGTYDLLLKYANGDDNNRPMRLSVNGAVEIASLDFFNAGRWVDWDFINVPVSLQAGSNAIRLTTVGNRGPNFDYLTVIEPQKALTISNASATEGIDDFLVFDLSLSAPGQETIALELG